MSKMYDVIVIGGGAAGCSAALFAVRRGLKTALISKDVGGQAATTCEIENYPGIDFVEGPELMQRFLQNAVKFGTTFIAGEVVGILKKDSLFYITTKDEIYEACSVILAFGLTPRSLDIPGAVEYENKGLIYSVLHDSEEHVNKKIAIIGGGNTALTAAEKLAPIASEIHIVHRRDELRAEKVLVDRIQKFSTIRYHLNTVPVEIIGDGAVESLVIADVDDLKNGTALPVDSIVVTIGYTTNTAWLGDLVELDSLQHIVVDKKNHTKTPGLFAAGDVTGASYKQIVISAGDGAKAALTAYEYLKEHFDIRGSVVDWGRMN